MTTTLERPDIAREHDHATARPSASGDQTIGRYLAWVLAVLSLGAGGIHFAVSGGHFDIAWRHGLFFAVVGWLQLAWAAAIVLRPSRKLLIVAAVVNAAVIATWAISRVWGVPVGPNAWTPEEVNLADALATVFEGAIVVGALALLLRPSLNLRRVRPLAAYPALAIAGIAVAVLSTLALTPSYASGNHGGSGSGGEAAAGSHGGAASAPAASGPTHEQGATNSVIQADGTSACEQAGVANEGNSGHGNRGPVPFTPLDPATRATFQQQAAAAQQVVAAYPTTADAEAAGWKRVTPYVPCIAAHYLKAGAFTNGFDPAEPEILLYEGTEPTSRLVGLSYLQFGQSDTAPDGFAGENDPWHVHSQLCIGGAGVLGDENTSEADCKARGGEVRKLDNLWMTHMWPAPGWDSRWGLFSSEHPDLGGRIGDINGEPLPEEDLDETNATE